MTDTAVPGLPFALHPVVPVGDDTWQVTGDAVRATAAPRTDIFVDPAGGAPKLDATRLLGELPDGDLQLSARVTVDFRGTFDAGVLLVWLDDAHWAKLCFEYSPTGQAMVVSVVNRTVSDDANAFPVDGSTAWLRVSRIGGVWAFHGSADGNTWHMVRIFGLDVAGVRPQLGFEVQAPVGDGCTVTFDRIRYSATTLADTRDGS